MNIRFRQHSGCAPEPPSEVYSLSCSGAPCWSITVPARCSSLLQDSPSPLEVLWPWSCLLDSICCLNFCWSCCCLSFLSCLGSVCPSEKDSTHSAAVLRNGGEGVKLFRSIYCIHPGIFLLRPCWWRCTWGQSRPDLQELQLRGQRLGCGTMRSPP